MNLPRLLVEGYIFSLVMGILIIGGLCLAFQEPFPWLEYIIAYSIVPFVLLAAYLFAMLT